MGSHWLAHPMMYHTLLVNLYAKVHDLMLHWPSEACLAMSKGYTGLATGTPKY